MLPAWKTQQLAEEAARAASGEPPSSADVPCVAPAPAPAAAVPAPAPAAAAPAAIPASAPPSAKRQRPSDSPAEPAKRPRTAAADDGEEAEEGELSE